MKITVTKRYGISISALTCTYSVRSNRNFFGYNNMDIIDAIETARSWGALDSQVEPKIAAVERIKTTWAKRAGYCTARKTAKHREDCAVCNCDNCNERIESAYADEDGEESE